MTLRDRDELPGVGEVIVEVAGCGVCHTDLGFYYDGVPTRQALAADAGARDQRRRRRGRAGRESGSGAPWSCRP
jgi:6-hydroxycyclohex-1-ene-1-carbonyl-CoA dehydrogenase